MAEKLLYFECETGISGDMAVAALLDLGANQEKLLRAVNSIEAAGFEVKISRVKKSGLDMCDFAVILDREHENHDHDMAYLYGHEQGAAHEHHHADDSAAAHGHEHHHGHTHDAAPPEIATRNQPSTQANDGDFDPLKRGSSHHHHEHRGLPEVLAIIDKAAMSDGAKAIARKIFAIIADAEAKAHGVPREEVHFHEVGAIDSIVDVVAVAVCLDDLALTECIIEEMTEGRGSVRCQHGILPIPVPAVANIAAAYHLPLRLSPMRGELITPTGAAIAAAIRTRGELPERFTIEKIGLGAGKRAYERPSFVRAMVISAEKKTP